MSTMTQPSPINRSRSDQARRRRRLEQETAALVWWGWALSILVAPVGFVIGVVLLAKGRNGHGIAMMVVATVVTASLLATAA